jgi:hypothetical protein
VKFLLWQFFAYALASMAAGALLASIWARSTRSALQRAFERARRTVEAERAANARIRKDRAADQLLVAEANDLATKLSEVRSALALVEADMAASQMNRAEAERSRLIAETQLMNERGFLVRAKRAEAEVLQIRDERDRLQSDLESLRSTVNGDLSRLTNERDALQEELAHISELHDSLVVSDQTERTQALLRAEEAESMLRARDAEYERLFAEFEALQASVVMSPASTRGALHATAVIPNTPNTVPVTIDLRSEVAVIEFAEYEPADESTTDSVSASSRARPT